MMRAGLFVVALAAGFSTGSGPAKALDMPWCAYLRTESITECHYYTYQQCLASVSGVGGICWQNPRYIGRYVEEDEPAPPRRRRPVR